MENTNKLKEKKEMENTKKIKRQFVIIDEGEFDKAYNKDATCGESLLDLEIEYDDGSKETKDILVIFDEDGIVNENYDIEYIYPQYD